MTAFAAGLIVFLPAPVLLRVFVLPLVLWFGLVGLAVPAAVVEGLGVRAGAAARPRARPGRLPARSGLDRDAP